MPTIFFFRGLPASGKSTKRHEMLADPSLHPIVYTNKDEIRIKVLVETQQQTWTKKVEKQVERLETAAVEEACQMGSNLIIDNTHGSPRHLRRYRDIANRHGYKLEIVEFDVSLDECIRRDALRSDSVGEAVIRRMYRESFVKPYCPDPSLPPAIIVDLDGTLAQIVDRSPFDFDKCGTDLVIKPVQTLVRAMVSSGAAAYVLFVTGRDETGREATEKWLDLEAGFKVDQVTYFLFMKAAGDQTPDTITKRDTFIKEIEPRFRVLFVLEDRKRVVEAWREMGVPCFQVAEKDD